MSRRHSAEKREVLPDPKFGNIIITKFMNSVMYAGKKSVAENIVYGALGMIEAKTKQPPLGVFEQALENVMPTIEVRSRRVGGARPTRCRWKSARCAVRRSASAG
ncbi:ribosomal protein S7 [Bradyrhizobium sp. JR3.5]